MTSNVIADIRNTRPHEALADLWDAAPGFLNTASYGLPPRPAWEALQRSLADWQRGCADWEVWADSVDKSRRLFAGLVGAPTERVFACGSVSEIAGLVASALPDDAEVLVPRGEFTSIVFPWAVHADRGVRVREVGLAELPDSIRPQTSVVAFAAVQSADGAVADAAAIASAAQECDALTFVDTTQATGWLPHDVAGFDVVACAAYKWLMCPRGTAFGVVSNELLAKLRPINAGWFGGEDVHQTYYGLPLRLARDARKFNISPAWHSWVATAATLAVIQDLSVSAIHDHDVALASRFRDGIGVPPSESAIVSVAATDAQASLRNAGIRAAVRDGATRLSFHAYNTDADVDRAISALA